MSNALTFTEKIAAAPEFVYRVLTSDSGVRQWLCDSSRIHLREGGSYLFAWNSGYYAAGQFTVVEPENRVAFSWRGHGQPGVTRVEITLTPEDEGTTVKLFHTGIGDGDEWDKARREFTHGWQVGLENLKYLLEKGMDRRIMRRPMLGLFPGPLTPEQAGQLRVPVSDGLLVGGVVDGMGAADAGLQNNDVIISLGGKPVTDFNSLGDALKPYSGGDMVEVVYYRGVEQRTVKMTLSARALPQVPPTVARLAEEVRSIYKELDAELDKLVKGVPEKVMAANPVKTEWSANQNLAHLIWTERYVHNWLFAVSGGADGNIPWPDNGPMHLVGALAIYPKSADLVAAFKREEAATAAMIETLPPEVVNDKPLFTAISQFVINNPNHHTRGHYDQMRRAIEAVKSAS